MNTPTPFGSKTAIGCKFGGSKAAEIIELDNHALASAELVGGNMVMRNTAGDTICTVDMNKIVPVELASDGLCMHFDFSVTPANPMQPVDLVNGLPIYNDDYTAANYSENGVELVNGSGANGFMSASLDVTNHYNYAQIPEYATLSEMLRAGTGLTVECFSKQPIPTVLRGYNKGIRIIGAESKIILPYLNSGGVSTSGSSTVVSTFADDAGNVYDINNAPGQEAMGLDKGYHMVFTADESGTLKVYLNGFTGTGTVTCADFAGWDYDTILAPTYWMFCQDDIYDAQKPKTVKKLRMYNRALSIDEVRSNYRYELYYTPKPAVSIAAATSNTFGGVKADPATEVDTQPVRIGTDGKLYTAQGIGVDGKSAYQYAQDGGYTGTEEEFTAKLAQEKFANPNALTFTGAVTGSYDGSAPLMVTIPEGGGGTGGGYSDYEVLIDETITTDEAGISAISYTELDFSQYNDIVIFFDRAMNKANTSGVRKVTIYMLGYGLFYNHAIADPVDSYRSSLFRVLNMGGGNVASFASTANNQNFNPSHLYCCGIFPLNDTYQADRDNGFALELSEAYIGTIKLKILAK